MHFKSPKDLRSHQTSHQGDSATKTGIACEVVSSVEKDEKSLAGEKLLLDETVKNDSRESERLETSDQSLEVSVETSIGEDCQNDSFRCGKCQEKFLEHDHLLIHQWNSCEVSPTSESLTCSECRD